MVKGSVKTAGIRAIRVGFLILLLGLMAFVTILALPPTLWSGGSLLSETEVVLLGTVLLLGGILTLFLAIRRELARRDRIERELRDSERLLRRAVEALEKRVAVLDAAGRVLSSTRVIDTSGRSRLASESLEGIESELEDRIGIAYVPDLEGLREDPTPQARAIWNGLHAVLEGEQREFQLEYPTLVDGETRWRLMRVKRLEGGEGAPVAVMDEDITDRVVAGQLLRESRDYLESLVTSMTDLVFALDPELHFLGVHGQWLIAMGADPVEVRALPPGKVFGQEAARALAGLSERVLEGEHLMHDWRVELAYGVRHLQTALSPLRDGEGEIIGIVGVGRDVTERARVERELRRRDAIMEAIGFASSHLLRSTDWKESIKDVLEHLAFATGAARVSLSERIDEQDGRSDLRTIQEWVEPGLEARSIVEVYGDLLLDMPGLRRWRDRLARGRPVIVRSRWLPRPAREELKSAGVESVTLIPVFLGNELAGILSLESLVRRVWSNNELEALRIAAGVLAAAFDRMRIEEALQESEAQLQQAQKMEAVGRLAGGIAHDFNNLLTAIKGRTELLLSDDRSQEEIGSDLEEIRAAALRAATLTRQLLAFSRRQVLEPKTLDLNQIVRGVEMMLRRLIGEDVILITRLASDLGPIQADPGHIEQVLMNLLINARDAMPEGGTVTIETQNLTLDRRAARLEGLARPGSYILLEVTDTGSGIPPELHERIFEPFFTTKEQGKGTGLGLSMIWGIVKQSGGHITVRSMPGKGSSFRIFLPRSSTTIEPTDPVEEAPVPATGSEVVLLVEDEAAVRSLVRKVLERRGYTVLEATNGAEAIQIAEAYRTEIDMILTDVVMPDIGGPALVEVLAPQIAGLRVLFMSGYTDQEVIRRGVDQFHAGFIGKPFSPDELARKVREVLDADLNPVG